MFFFFAVLSMIGYAVQGTFLVKYSRRMDGLSLATYRNLSLAITLLPLIFLAGKPDWAEIRPVFGYILAGAVCGAISLSCTFRAQKSLPVGVENSLGGIRVLLLLLFGFLFWQERISLWQIAFIGVILSGVVFLALQKHHMPHLDGKVLRGLSYSFLNNVFGSAALFFMSFATRNAHPLLVGYIWEVLIGLCALGLVGGRSVWSKKGLQQVSPRDFISIALISSFTLVGTGALALAVSRGPVGIVSAVGSAGIVVGTLLSHFLYHEKLRLSQWLAIGIIVAGILALRLIAL